MLFAVLCVFAACRERSSKAGQPPQPQLSMQPRKSMEVAQAGGRVKATHKSRSRKEDLLQVGQWPCVHNTNR